MKKSSTANNLLCFLSFLFVIIPACTTAGEASSRQGWSTAEFVSNGENIHLEMPVDAQVSNDGSLVTIFGMIGNNQYSIWTTTTPRAGVDVEQAISIVTTIIQNNGGYVREVKKSKKKNQWLVDLDGGCPNHLLILKGRIILTPKNVYYLEMLSPDGNNSFTEFFNQCWIK